MIRDLDEFGQEENPKTSILDRLKEHKAHIETSIYTLPTPKIVKNETYEPIINKLYDQL